MSRIFPRPDLYLSTAKSLRIALKRGVLPGAPEALKGVSALFLSDVHLQPGVDPARLRSMIDDAHADLILFGGDFSDTREETLRLLNALRGIFAPLGIFAVPGNNDTEAFDTPEALARALEQIGCRLLVNESTPILGGALSVGGLDEHLRGHPDYARVFPRRGGAKLLLSHYPILPQASEGDMPDWMLSGHTHGGQFNFLGLTPFAIGFERVGGMGRLAPALVSGVWHFGRTTMLVSKGIGTSRIPLRIGVRPEIHLLTFA